MLLVMVVMAAHTKQNNDCIVSHLFSSAELLLHEKHLECHCDEVEEALKNERAEFLRFCNQQNDSIQNLDSRIRDMESAFLRSPVAERSVCQQQSRSACSWHCSEPLLSVTEMEMIFVPFLSARVTFFIYF